MGCLPGAVAGAGVGSLVAQIVAEPLCKWANDEPQDPVDQEVQDWHDNQYGAWNASRVFPNQQHQGYFPTVYAPHEYVADGASY
ncbi:MAG: hypothetical protein OXI11_11625 [Gammaproteobacteria bacterium]|nr:hypothetical protein [Gammaproteobacteria bacterium]MXW44821.1 hypothetical protein [Gammaproteobacteria bacterium]MYD02052.1 hypothetical protein [Gammaproteobacteria bacterium]MYI24017.1 hypothetical protein [Gammaproteobacteria bacterium]